MSNNGGQQGFNLALLLVGAGVRGGAPAIALGSLFALFAFGFGLLVLGLSFGVVGVVAGVALLAMLGLIYPVVRAHTSAADRRTLAAAERDWAAWLAQFPPSLHQVIWRLSDPMQAMVLWSDLGLGRMPNPAKGDPGAAPLVLPWLNPGPGKTPDRGIWATRTGIRVRLAMLPGQSPKLYAERLANMSTSFDVPDVRVVSSDGQQLVLELKVYDPLKELNVSHLIDPDTRARVAAAVRAGGTPAEQSRRLTEACRAARLTIPVGALSCTDDIPLMMSETGEWITINLAAGGHGAIQGATRSGKSITINSLLAWASLMRDVRVVIIDPNTAAVAPWWRTAHLVYDGTDPEEATAILDQVYDELAARKALFWQQRSDKITQFSPETPLYLIVVDEVAEFAKDKAFQEALKRVGAQVAKFGGRLYPAGQKLDTDSISMGTRANLFDRICHRVESRHEFAHLFENAPALEAAGLTAVDETMPQGVAIVRTRSHPATCRARSVFLPTEACWVISDAIVAARGEVRALPGTEPVTALPAPDSNAPAIEAAATVTSLNLPAPEEVKLESLALPTELPDFMTKRTVIPFDRGARQDPTGTE
ncbi:FtsK/SpoIIIE domain-containing protein [Nocardia cyriacigeorgica]|uniref:FtsK/SpoIIIE domain-containing protein n=1 Tax=Nocardia cyriacigeorgica TaxID=135487 RepID=UPI002458C605|nr:FtsK/SpoIIIE domain-containing protein [Nocardia cyriacigeorgica]